MLNSRFVIFKITSNAGRAILKPSLRTVRSRLFLIG